MTRLDDAIRAVRPPDRPAMAAARARQAALTKPAGSLGSLERLHVQLAGIARTSLPMPERPWVIVMAADHGVAAENVSAYPRRATAEMVRNFAAGGAAINVLAREAGASLLVADLGVDWENAAPPPGVVMESLGPGTANIARGPAMTRAEALRALEVGVEVVRRAAGEGADLIALGDMGIANTTASAAIVAATTGQPARVVTGIGTGLDPDGWEQKVRTVERALEANAVDPGDPLGLLAALGGFEIAGLAGAIVGGAAVGLPVVLDGMVVGAAALVASALCPAARPYLIASHRSAEPGHRVALEYLEIEPLMDLGLRLGEGSGAALALQLIRAACRLPREMATFDEAGVSRRSDQPSEFGHQQVRVVPSPRHPAPHPCHPERSEG